MNPNPHCSCQNAVHSPTGAIRAVSKCEPHRRAYRDPTTLDERYFVENAAFGGTHLPELLEALGPFPAAMGSRAALEIGCGCSPYAGAIRAAGWRYSGIDVSPWAARWTAGRYGVSTWVADWESWSPPGPCGLILAAHVIEHLIDAPAAFAKIAASLEPKSELWIVIPDDSDLANPDHLWFFNEQSLTRAVSLAGLRVAALAKFRRIERENFLYCRAIKR